MSSAQVTSFSPIINEQATRLILGSMPGIASLKAAQYYAHPQNAFWRIMAAVLGFKASASYADRVAALHKARIAVWDVLASCERPGSLDASIRRDSEVVNDFDSLFNSHPAITHVYFNGAAAETSFRRHCAAWLSDPRIKFQRPPSTSPAHASLRFEQKLALWSQALCT
jgi:double-stranded uracil-DNA glycosylase